MDDGANILKLLYRPREPVYWPKCESGCMFKIPKSYLNPRVSQFNIEPKEGSVSIQVDEIAVPDITRISELKKDETFSIFNPRHNRIAKDLIEIFLSAPTTKELLSLVCYIRDRVNPFLLNYCISVAVLHRDDTRKLDLPSSINVFPDKYIDFTTITRAKEDINVFQQDQNREPIEIPQDLVASDLDPEHKLAYFREDIGVNLHHWHWHLVYPLTGEKEIIDKDRRGELFYYMHHQIMARYNCERLCNNMKRVERLMDFSEPIKEAYFPKLDSSIAGRVWPGRPANLKFSNLRIDAEEIYRDIDDLYRWRDRIFNAIEAGFVISENGETVELDEFEGIDHLGNIIEASDLSLNQPYYGNLHNMGHNFLAYIHDPEHRNLERVGVMGDSGTAMRDPVFYRWHAYVDYLFQTFKSTLPRYDEAKLNFPGVTVEKVRVATPQSEENTFHTYWHLSDVDISSGLDFQPRDPISVRLTHLNHLPFNYHITYINKNAKTKGTCRIFLAPKFNDRGIEWLFREQRNMFIELDKFTVDLDEGTNTIQRLSTESSVTIPFERTFRKMDEKLFSKEGTDQDNFCGCGWPQHMLIPKGNAEGFKCQLFVMISNYNDDKIEQDVNVTCKVADSFCGIRNKKYPDKRSMGYPFDREPREGVRTLQQFLTSNMRVVDCKIKFSNQKYKLK